LIIPSSIQLELGSEQRIRARTLATFILISLSITAPLAIYLWFRNKDHLSTLPLAIYFGAMLLPALLLRFFRALDGAVISFILGASGFVQIIYVFYDRANSPILNWVPILIFLTMVVASPKDQKRLLTAQLIVAALGLLAKFRWGESLQIFMPEAESYTRRIILSLLFLCFCVYELVKAVFELSAHAQREKNAKIQNETIEKRITSTQHLAAGLAHEINNPLTVIMGNLYSVEKSLGRLEVEPNLQSRIRTALAATSRIYSVVDRLTNWVNLEHKSDEQFTPFELAVVVNNLVQDQKAFIDREKIQVEQHISKLILPHQQKSIQFILSEIFDNAIHATIKGEDRRIYIKAETNLGWCEIQIANTGPAISDQESVVMFDPFVTTHNVGIARGLGLPLALTVITSLNGKISFIRHDPYTIFSVYLPVVGQDVTSEVA
jgi:signal transduction histidine kinase